MSGRGVPRQTYCLYLTGNKRQLFRPMRLDVLTKPDQLQQKLKYDATSLLENIIEDTKFKLYVCYFCMDSDICLIDSQLITTCFRYMFLKGILRDVYIQIPISSTKAYNVNSRHICFVAVNCVIIHPEMLRPQG